MSTDKKKRIVSVEEIIDSAIVDLEYAQKAFYYLWDRFFAYTEEPEEYRTSFQEISYSLTAYKLLVEHGLDKLMAVHERAGEYLTAELESLYKAVNGELDRE